MEFGRKALVVAESQRRERMAVEGLDECLLAEPPALPGDEPSRRSDSLAPNLDSCALPKRAVLKARQPELAKTRRRAGMMDLYCLTLELSRTWRHGRQGRPVKMYRVPPAGPGCHAAGCRLERRVRPRLRAVKAGLQWPHHCASQGTPLRSPSILTPGHLARKYFASAQDVI